MLDHLQRSSCSIFRLVRLRCRRRRWRERRRSSGGSMTTTISGAGVRRLSGWCRGWETDPRREQRGTTRSSGGTCRQRAERFRDLRPPPAGLWGRSQLQPPQKLTAHGALGLDEEEFASGRSEVGWPSLSGRRFNVVTCDGTFFPVARRIPLPEHSVALQH